MKEASNKLFLLIKSLSKSEKRYFRQYAARHTIGEKNNYLLLFDAIQRQEHYDEVELKTTLKDASYLSYFSVAKSYLYDQILESLHWFYQGNSIHEKIKKQLHYCEILSKRGLFDAAQKTIKKAEAWIEKYQLYEYHPILIEVTRRLMQGPKRMLNGKESYEKFKSNLERLDEINWYWHQSNRILSMHYQKINLQDAKQQNEFTKILEELEQKGAPQQLQSQLAYYRILATAAFMQGKREVAYEYNKKALELFEKQAVLIEMEPQMYIGSFNNFLIDNFTLGKFDVVEAGIEKLRSLPKQAIFKSLTKLESNIFELTYTLQLNARITQKNFKAAIDLIPFVQKGLKKHNKSLRINYRLQFNYLIAYIFFVNKAYEESLTCLDVIRQPKYKNVMQELVLAAERLRFLTYFELDNYLLLESLEAAIKRFRKKKNEVSLLENTLFKYLKKIANPVLSKKEKAHLYKELRDALLNIKKEGAEARAWIYFDFDAWLDKKLQNDF